MEFTAKTIADHLQGDIEGNADVKVSTIARIEQGKPGSLCFLANPKYEKYLYTTDASIVLVNRSLVLKQPVKATLVRVDDAYQGIASMLDLYQASQAMSRKGREWRSRVSWRAKLGKNVYVGSFAYVASKAQIGNNVKIFPNTYIGDGVVIGDNTILYAGVKIYPGCKIGANCIIHAGAVIGSDGFGFAPLGDGSYKKIQQTGNVVVEDDVEIGANSTIDCSTMGSTFIRKGVKLDNLVHIAHNVEIGENTAIAALSGIAGSAKLGKRCILAGQSGVVGHMVLGDDVQIGSQAGVTNSYKSGSKLQGTPAFDIRKFQRSSVVFRNLPDMLKDVLALKKAVFGDKKEEENEN